jgi:NADH-quinone oxidoreductase subunit A
MLTTFIPILIAGIVAFLLAIAMTLFAVYLGPRQPGYHKEDPYECGIVSDKPVIRRFDIRYYMIAILFIGFDVEIIFLYPWAVAYNKLGLFGFVEMLIFVLILLIAYVYAIKNGVFEWSLSKGRKVVRYDNPWEEFRGKTG